MLSSSKIVVCTLSKIEVSHVIYAAAAKSLLSCLTLCDPVDKLLRFKWLSCRLWGVTRHKWPLPSLHLSFFISNLEMKITEATSKSCCERQHIGACHTLDAKKVFRFKH